MLSNLYDYRLKNNGEKKKENNEKYKMFKQQQKNLKNLKNWKVLNKSSVGNSVEYITR